MLTRGVTNQPPNRYNTQYLNVKYFQIVQNCFWNSAQKDGILRVMAFKCLGYFLKRPIPTKALGIRYRSTLKSTKAHLGNFCQGDLEPKFT